MRAEWNITLFHYRNHGADYGRILVGIDVPESDNEAFTDFLESLGYVRNKAEHKTQGRLKNFRRPFILLIKPRKVYKPDYRFLHKGAFSCASSSTQSIQNHQHSQNLLLCASSKMMKTARNVFFSYVKNAPVIGRNI
jgi:hypothetical protein